MDVEAVETAVFECCEEESTKFARLAGEAERAAKLTVTWGKGLPIVRTTFRWRCCFFKRANCLMQPYIWGVESSSEPSSG